MVLLPIKAAARHDPRADSYDEKQTKQSLQ